jgi:hypothetical protein
VMRYYVTSYEGDWKMPAVWPRSSRPRWSLATYLRLSSSCPTRQPCDTTSFPAGAAAKLSAAATIRLDMPASPTPFGRPSIGRSWIAKGCAALVLVGAGDDFRPPWTYGEDPYPPEEQYLDGTHRRTSVH